MTLNRAEPKPTPVPTPATLPIDPGTWQADATHSSLEFTVRHLMVSNVRGRFTNFNVTLEAGDSLENSLLFVTIDATSLTTSNPMRDKHLQGRDFFDTARHPNITFIGTKITPLDATGERYSVEGDLTILETSKPMTLEVTLSGQGRDHAGRLKAGFSASGQFERSAWGLTYNQPLEGGGVMISDTVRLEIEVQFTRGAERERTLLERVQGVATILKAHEDEIESSRRLPPVVAEALRRAGVFKTFVPRELGGLEVNPVEWMDMVEALSKINSAAGWLAMTNAGAGLANMDVAAAKALLKKTPDPIIAANVAMGGQATPVEGGYRISGRWGFASGCQNAEWFGGMSIVLENGAPVRNENGDMIIGAALFSSKDFKIVETWDTLGMRGSGSHDIAVKDVFVPKEHFTVMGDSMPKIHPGPLYKTPFLLMAHASQAVGIARAALEAFIQIENGPGMTMMAQSLGRETTQVNIAQAEAIVRSAKSFSWDAVRQAYNEASAGEVSAEANAMLHLSMVHAVRECARAVDLVYTAAGPRAVYAGSVLERAFRDIHTVTQHLLALAQNYRIVGMYLLTKDQPGGPVYDDNMKPLFQ